MGWKKSGRLTVYHKMRQNILGNSMVDHRVMTFLKEILTENIIHQINFG